MSKPIPYHIIFAAKAGDKEAMDAILKHYDSFFTQLATRPTQDQYGNSYNIVDKYMKDRIAAACLHEFIYTFDPMKLPPGETIED